MKKSLAVCLLGLFLIGSIAYFGHGQTAQEVLDKMIQAQGGRKAVASIKDTTMNGTVEMITMGISGTITMYQKEPDKMRIDMEFMGQVVTQAYDGEKGWMIVPQMGTQEATGKQGEDLKKQAISLSNDAMLNPEKYGITFAFKGKEKIQDKEYLVLEQAFKDGDKATMHIDPATYLIFKSKSKSTDPSGAEVDAETFSSDYKKVGDSMVPHTITVFQSGAEFLKMTFSKVTYNTGLEDAFFKMSK